MKLENPPRNAWGSFLYLLRFARADAGAIGCALFILTLASTSSVVSARLIANLVDQGLSQKNASAAYTFGFGVLALELMSVGTTYWGRRILARKALNCIFRIRQRAFQKLSELPMKYFDQTPLGRTVTRISYDVDGLEDFFSGTLARLVMAFLSLAIVMLGMLLTYPKLGLVLIASIFPSILCTYAFRHSLRHWNREFARRNSAINSRLSEYLSGIPVIRSFGAEDWSQKGINEVVGSYRESAIRINVLNSFARPLVAILCQLPLLILIGWGSPQVMAGTLALGIFVTFIRYCERFSRPISALAQEIQTIQVAFTSAERISRFLEERSEVTELGENGSVEDRTLRGEIEFRNVSMSYTSDRPVLSQINLHILPGQKIGLAGETGSGKSTTLALLARLYEFQEGEILLDGLSIREWNRETLRHQMGYVSQDVIIFKGTVRDNLNFGETQSDAVLLAACEKMGLLSALARNGRGLDSELLDQGSNLSQGERQLLSLTRVLVKNPAILILDEATAHIDPALEKLVFTALEELMKGRTSFLIAHRLESLQTCDQILVFRNSKIVETGTHAKLFAQNGYYTELNWKYAKELSNPNGISQA